MDPQSILVLRGQSNTKKGHDYGYLKQFSYQWGRTGVWHILFWGWLITGYTLSKENQHPSVIHCMCFDAQINTIYYTDHPFCLVQCYIYLDPPRSTKIYQKTTNFNQDDQLCPMYVWIVGQFTIDQDGGRCSNVASYKNLSLKLSSIF